MWLPRVALRTSKPFPNRISAKPLHRERLSFYAGLHATQGFMVALTLKYALRGFSRHVVIHLFLNLLLSCVALSFCWPCLQAPLVRRRGAVCIPTGTMPLPS